MYIVKITNNTPLCKMVNFSRSVLKIYTGQKKFTRAAPVAPVTNIRYAKDLKFHPPSNVSSGHMLHVLLARAVGSKELASIFVALLTFQALNGI